MRMMTGKKNKLTAEEKEQKRVEGVKERDEYVQSHLGGFTKIYPLAPEHPNQVIYEKLLKMEGEVEPTKKQKQEPQLIVRRNTQKFTKLPLLSKDSHESKH